MNEFKGWLMMKEYEEVIVEKLKEIPKSITCNKCGNSAVLVGTEVEREIESNAFQTIHLNFNYGSKFDLEHWRFELCEDCLDEFVKSFKHPPEKSE